MITQTKGVRGFHSPEPRRQRECEGSPRPKECLSFRACRGISWKGTILKPARGGVKLSPSVKQVPLSPFPRERAPRRLLRGATSRSRSAGAFPNCVTRFRGGALRHAKFPKTSYKVQLLDTLKHAACVSLNRGRRRALIFLSNKVLIFLYFQNPANGKLST